MNKTLIISNVTLFCCPRIIAGVPLCGVYSPFSEGLLSDSSFLYRHQPADIQYFARTHQASASPQKSSIIWTCSLRIKNASLIGRRFLILRLEGELPHYPLTALHSVRYPRGYRPTDIALRATSRCKMGLFCTPPGTGIGFFVSE